MVFLWFGGTPFKRLKEPLVPHGSAQQRQALDGGLHRGPAQQLAEAVEGVVDEGHGDGAQMFLETGTELRRTA